MNVLILAGGKGTRFREETVIKPKPMIEIGGKPILWHIIKIYSFWDRLAIYFSIDIGLDLGSAFVVVFLNLNVASSSEEC